MTVLLCVVSLLLGGAVGYGARSVQFIRYFQGLECQHIWKAWEPAQIDDGYEYLRGQQVKVWSPGQMRFCQFCDVSQTRRVKVDADERI